MLRRKAPFRAGNGDPKCGTMATGKRRASTRRRCSIGRPSKDADERERRNSQPREVVIDDAVKAAERMLEDEG